MQVRLAVGSYGDDEARKGNKRFAVVYDYRSVHVRLCMVFSAMASTSSPAETLPSAILLACFKYNVPAPAQVSALRQLHLILGTAHHRLPVRVHSNDV